MNNNEFVSEFLDNLALGNGSIINITNSGIINNIALELYEKRVLDSTEQDTLKKVIMICNIIYNRTDLETPFVSDGMYDLLLEKYKTYDSNFQVGSMVVDFKADIENNPETCTKVARCPISFKTPHKAKNEISQQIFDSLTYYRYPTREELLYKPPEVIEVQDISKRKHNTEHNHPSLVGTLDKAKFVLNQDAIDAGVFDDPNVKVLERDFFQDHIYKGLLNPNDEIEIVCELKYDGISIEADCLDEVVSARTRGDTGIGQAADMTPILKGYKFPNAEFLKDSGWDPVGVKFEAIINRYNLQKFCEQRGKTYINGRTAIIGLFGASDAYLFRDLITLVPLAVDPDSIPNWMIKDRMDEIKLLEVFSKDNYNLRYSYFKGTLNEALYFIKCFWDEAKIARDYIDFMYDGIVVSYVDPVMRNKLGRKNYINKYSMAVKFDPLEKQTIFRGYTYEVGQNGNITPMIHYDPVEFLGTIHTKSTGSSLDRFNKLGLKYGDYISVTYVNDVMPYVSSIDCEHNRTNPNPLIEIIHNCPVCGSELVVSESGKTLKCPNLNCKGRSIQRMVNMFQKMNIKGFSDAAFIALNKTHLWELATLSELELVNILGDVSGKNFYSAMQYLMTEPQKDYIIIGALGFSGIAHKKWQTILQGATIKDIEDMFIDCKKDPLLFEIVLNRKFPGIGPATVNVIANEWGVFEDDILFILNKVNIVNCLGSGDAKMQIRFTGFRNSQLSQQLNTAGYDADDNGSITKKTDILLIPYDGFISSKVVKARKNPNTKIVPIDEFLNNMKAYIGEDIR